MKLMLYSSVYIRLVLICLLAVKVTLAYIIKDLSISKFCQDGLLDSKDTIHIEIKINLRTEIVKEDPSLTFWTTKANERIKLCEITYDDTCSNVSTAECYCKGPEELLTIFVYKTTATYWHSDIELFINDDQTPATKLPVVHGQARVTLGVDMERQFDSLNEQFCSTSAMKETTVLFRFCAYNLSEPEIHLSYGGFKEVGDDHTTCIAVAFCVHETDTPLEFTYLDRCGRASSIYCIIEVFSDGNTTSLAETTTTTSTSTATTIYDIITPPPSFSGYSWVQIGLIACGLIVVIFAFTAIYYQLKSSRFHRESTSKPDTFQSSPVDLDLKRSSSLARTTMKLSVSQTQRLKLTGDVAEQGTSV